MLFIFNFEIKFIIFTQHLFKISQKISTFTGHTTVQEGSTVQYTQYRKARHVVRHTATRPPRPMAPVSVSGIHAPPAVPPPPPIIVGE